MRRVRVFLWLTAVTAVCGGGMAIAFLIAAPIPISQAGTAATTRPAGSSSVLAEESLPSRAALQAAWSLNLRRPLFDPPPTPVVEKPKPAPPPLTVKLAGTIIEPNLNKALLIGPDGKTQLRAVGEKVGDVEILGIDADSVTVRHNGEPVTLRILTGEKAR